MIGESFIAQEQALSEFAIGSKPFPTHIIINTTLFLVFFFQFNYFGMIPHSTLLYDRHQLTRQWY